ncbi:MAG: response regulator [Acidimicrobiia bacterium]|nr:response regulator [Acidimicrobiia bacterium]
MATKIVLAEDEAIIRLDLRESLIEEGYEVVGDVGRGDKAVEIVRETRPDVAIFDIKMPGMSGLEAAKIVSDEKLCAVVMLTAFSQREIIEQARDAGALAYIVKPTAWRPTQDSGSWNKFATTISCTYFRIKTAFFIWRHDFLLKL